MKPGKSSCKTRQFFHLAGKKKLRSHHQPVTSAPPVGFFFFFTRSVIHQISDGVSMRAVTANGRSLPQKPSEKIDIKEDKTKVKSSCDGAGSFTSLKNTDQSDILNIDKDQSKNPYDCQ